jgi:hypothetical protein
MLFLALLVGCSSNSAIIECGQSSEIAWDDSSGTGFSPDDLVAWLQAREYGATASEGTGDLVEAAPLDFTASKGSAAPTLVDFGTEGCAGQTGLAVSAPLTIHLESADMSLVVDGTCNILATALQDDAVRFDCDQLEGTFPEWAVTAALEEQDNRCDAPADDPSVFASFGGSADTPWLTVSASYNESGLCQYSSQIDTVSLYPL